MKNFVKSDKDGRGPVIGYERPDHKDGPNGLVGGVSSTGDPSPDLYTTRMGTRENCVEIPGEGRIVEGLFPVLVNRFNE